MDGFTGAPAITVEADEVEDFWSNLGTVWTIERNYVKPYPICRWAHAALDALSGLMQSHSFSSDDVTSIEVNTFAEAAALFAGLPATTSQAQYSLPFALAVMLVHGRVGPEDISGAGLSDAKVAEALTRVTLHENVRHSKRFPAARWSDIIVTLKDGTCLASGDVQARGGPEAPMELSEIEAKFRMMAAALPEPRTTALWEMREHLFRPGVKFSELAELVRAPLEETYV
jgi:2-methylcitrate dehydratase PrpD